MEWLAAIEELERLNSLLGPSQDPNFGTVLEQRGRVIERIATLVRSPGPPPPDVVERLSGALGGVANIRQELALRRERMRAEMDGLNHAGVLLRRLQNPGGSASRIDCCG